MKFQITVLCAAAAFAALSTSAMAADPITAKLQTPMEANQKIVAAGAVFTCVKDTCVAPAPTSNTGDTGGCRELVKKVGALTAFGTSLRPFNEEQLAKCNSAAGK